MFTSLAKKRGNSILIKSKLPERKERSRRNFKIDLPFVEHVDNNNNQEEA